jgi:hypothetical protein
MKCRAFVLPVVILISLSLVACNKNSSVDTSKFTVEVVDGVKQIHNIAPQRGGTPGITLELIGKIGELEGKADKDILYDPVDAARLPNGDILILEGSACSVKRYNKDHEYISSFGQKGLGPGDFISPYSLRLNRNRNKLFVADNKTSWFSLDGRFIGSFKPARTRLSGGSSITQQYRTSGMALLSDSSVILPSDTSMWEEHESKALLTVYDGTGRTVRSFGAITRFDDPRMTLSANIIYFATNGEDNCYVAYAHQNRIDKYSREGELLLSADRRLPYGIKTEMKDEIFTSGPMKQVISWPSVTSVARSMGVDGDKRIWVLTYLIQPNRFGGFDDEVEMSRCYRFDVFDPQGILQFTVASPNVKFSGFSIYDDRMYLIDPGQESCVYEYRIVEKD